MPQESKAVIPKEKLQKYFEITTKAIEKAKAAPENLRLKNARTEFLDTIKRYIDDAHYFKQQGKIVEAFAALNYAHGWLDAGAKIGLWDVNDSSLFAGVDG